MFSFLKRKEKVVQQAKQEPLPEKKIIDWRSSHAHLNLLTRFIEPRQTNDTSKFQQWTGPLGEPVEIAIKRFLDLKLIERANIVEHLLIGFNGSQLKQMLISHSLPVSGTKQVMAKRLIENDAQGMSKTVAGLFILVCSESGKKLAEAYLDYEDHRRRDTIQQSETALQQNRYRDAALIAAKYEADSVFPRGLWLSTSTSGESNHWSHYNPTRDEMILSYIFAKTPKLFSKRGWDKLPDIRLVSGMLHLWGTIESAPKENDIEIKTVAYMLMYHAKFLIEMDEYRRLGFKYARVSTCNDDTVCGPCKKLAKTKHRIDDMPELPYEYCKEELGCRCSISIAID